ncbi:GNAT family N-acetyltransferase [Paraliomyxa miuraensis]|uniref:GNAT family N-acetyltransferase n=1 Tax=Paraliomyxa miuraensis TaxID=376150 RepID=UPI00224FF012|nr:GNAT family N-acetyltransferase [Paraliomyxa miuraensis]MCX4240552.1 GNAT family N-acetyltransferase [Paraliomyxa miuraensis]
MLDKVISKLQDAERRHQERHTPLGLRYVIADGIDFLNPAHWDAIAAGASVFLGRAYLGALERNAPSNTEPRYAIVYREETPAVILACQIARIGGEQLVGSGGGRKAAKRILGQVRERVLVCGNLVSSGLHGIAFAEGLDPELGWRAVAEILYRIRRGEKLHGSIDFVMIKDLVGESYAPSTVLERYSYRTIKSDPTMVLALDPPCRSFEDYLSRLTAKYRGKIKKIGKTLEQAGYRVERVADLHPIEEQLHALYLQVESRAAVRLATIPCGYFSAMQAALGDRFVCSVIRNDEAIVGFVTTVIDGAEAIGYYVGVDYSVNAELPVYLRLLQLVIADGAAAGCTTISLGRTALEPKANLGAKPVDAHVWMRHRVPAFNFVLRELFPMIPVDEAPERNPLKEK